MTSCCECDDDDDELLFCRLPAPLPPLPPPDPERRTQAQRGIVVVVASVVVVFASTAACATQLSQTAALTFLVVTCTEGLVAVACLAAVLLKDPCVVKRSAETLQPMPAEVAERLNDKAPLRDEIECRGGMSNIRNGARSYCVRCFLWRNHETDTARRSCLWRRRRAQTAVRGVAVHHCRICQRCVRHFDHHCSVLGRCVAGHGLHGNRSCFRLLIAMAWAGSLTVCSAAGLAVWEQAAVRL